MTGAEIVDAVARIRYKPGWTLRVDPDSILPNPPNPLFCDMPSDPGWQPRRLEIGVQTRDPQTGEPMRIVHLRLMRHVRDLDDLLIEVFVHLCAVERHEAGEFFAYEQRRPFDPHASELPLRTELAHRLRRDVQPV